MILRCFILNFFLKLSVRNQLGFFEGLEIETQFSWFAANYDYS